jgi:hypothetical protein
MAMVRYHEIDPFRRTSKVETVESQTGETVRARGKQIRVGRMDRKVAGSGSGGGSTFNQAQRGERRRQPFAR